MTRMPQIFIGLKVLSHPFAYITLCSRILLLTGSLQDLHQEIVDRDEEIAELKAGGCDDAPLAA